MGVLGRRDRHIHFKLHSFQKKVDIGTQFAYNLCAMLFEDVKHNILL